MYKSTEHCDFHNFQLISNSVSQDFERESTVIPILLIPLWWPVAKPARNKLHFKMCMKAESKIWSSKQ